MNPENLSQHEKDILLRHFFYYLPQDASAFAVGVNRRTLMREYPAIYNRACERQIVQTVYVADGREVI